MVPPVPFPNTEVKRCSPNDSASIGGAKVGRRQSLRPSPKRKLGEGLFLPKGLRKEENESETLAEVDTKGICVTLLNRTKRGNTVRVFQTSTG